MILANLPWKHPAAAGWYKIYCALQAYSLQPVPRSSCCRACRSKATTNNKKNKKERKEEIKSRQQKVAETSKPRSGLPDCICDECVQLPCVLRAQ